jgi:hypothetical protein
MVVPKAAPGRKRPYAAAVEAPFAHDRSAHLDQIDRAQGPGGTVKQGVRLRPHSPVAQSGRAASGPDR